MAIRKKNPWKMSSWSQSRNQDACSPAWVKTERAWTRLDIVFCLRLNSFGTRLRLNSCEKKIIQPPQISLNGVIELWKVDQLDLSWEHGQTNNGWQGTWDVRKKKTHTYIYRICTHGTTKIYVIHLHMYNVFIYIYNNIYIYKYKYICTYEF